MATITDFRIVCVGINILFVLFFVFVLSVSVSRYLKRFEYFSIKF